MRKNLTEKDTNTEAITSVILREEEFSKLSFAKKRTYLDKVLPEERMALILSDTDNKKLTRAMQPQELYWLFKENGASDSVALLGLASPLQCVFILDMEFWRKWTFMEDQAVEYFGYILKGSEEHFQELLPHLDFNLLSIFLSREIIVTGGIGDLNTDEERLTDWDHTFDDVFLIKFKKPEHTVVIGAFLELVCRFDNSLYTALMESVSGEIDTESEEECYRLKSGRLADLGFPPYDEAIEIYSRVNPATFTPGCDKELFQIDEAVTLPEMYLSDKTFLERVILQMDSELFRSELNYLINTALVADEAPFADMEYMNSVAERVYGYLNIALEYLSKGDKIKGAEILAGEHLKKLFQLGFSIVLGLKFRADKLIVSNYAAAKVLSGLKSTRPGFYRGLDSDCIDNFRAFREMQDVITMSDFLKELED